MLIPNMLLILLLDIRKALKNYPNFWYSFYADFKYAIGFVLGCQ